MWILSCANGLFGGKKYWLRAGTSHLLGRTSGRPEGNDVERISFIDHKSVSRKHLLIEVASLSAKETSELHKRTQLKLTDASKVGTTIDGETITKTTKTLDSGREKKHVFRLGKYEVDFTLEWKDVVFTCKNLSKKGAETLEEKRRMLDGVDAKLVTEYVSNMTTHVFGKKRNTAEVIQALLQGRWVLGYGYLDELARVTSRPRPNGNGDVKASPLEEDFDANWPDEKRYILEAGSEINPQPDSYLLPNPDRSDMFHDYIFVFLSQDQLERLMPVVTSGGGKAVVFPATPDQSSVDEVISYFREVAGHKDDSPFALSQYTGKGGVVFVRPNDAGRVNLVQEVELRLDQKGVEQNRFLDIVLTMDTTSLRQRLAERSQSVQEEASERVRPTPPPSEERRARTVEIVDDEPTQQRPPISAQPDRDEQADEPPREEPAVAKPRWKRQPFKSRFRGFDDFDPSQYASEDPEPSVQSFADPSQAQSARDMDVDEPSQSVGTTQPSARKRPAPSQAEPEPGGDMLDSILQGQAAFKRRKTEAAKAGIDDAFSRTAAEAAKAAAEKEAKAKRKAEKQIHVKAQLKARREAEEEQRKEDEETLKELHGIDVHELKNLVQIEEFELPVRERPSQASGENDRSDRWDPAWNGRKNFKKFRPQGQRRDLPRVQRVIVTLEPVPPKGHGLEGEYFLNKSAVETGTARRGKSKSQSQSQSRSVRDAAAHNDEEETAFRRRIQRSREEDAEQEATQSAMLGAPRGGRPQGAPNGTISQTLGTESQRKAAGKRPAASQAVGAVQPPAKKTKQSTLRTTTAASTTSSRPRADEGEDDDLAFRRRRK
jgi:hypothetical protein